LFWRLCSQDGFSAPENKPVIPIRTPRSALLLNSVPCYRSAFRGKTIPIWFSRISHLSSKALLANFHAAFASKAGCGTAPIFPAGKMLEAAGVEATLYFATAHFTR
jgi:hypothetical protein